MSTLRLPAAQGLLLALACCVCSVTGVEARHIVGGEVTYECLGPAADGTGQRYLLRFEIYRDALGEGALLDSDDGAFVDFTFAVYDGTRLVRQVTIRRDEFEKEAVRPEDNPCVEEPPDLLTERGFYRKEIVLPIIDRSYTITYQRCCRNERILNIVNPGETGSTFYIDITPEAQRSCNSSPRFLNYPPLIICDSVELNFDHSAVDAEGDQLVYRMCEPVTGGGLLGSQGNPGDPAGPDGVAPDPETPPPYTPVVYREPEFTALVPITGAPALSLDEVTGNLRVRPLQPGNYVLCLSVEEYRDGELLSVVRRDLQIEVIDCESIVQAAVTATGTDESETVPDAQVQFVQFCGSRDGTVFDRSTGGDALAGIEWLFLGTVDGTVTSTDSVVRLEYPDYGIYDGRIVAKTELECNDTLDFKLRVTPPTQAVIEYSLDSCIYGAVEFRDRSFTEADAIEEVNWDFGGPPAVADQRDQSVFFERAGIQNVSLEVIDDNTCRSVDSVTFEYYPVPGRLPASLDNSEACVPAGVEYFFEAPFVTDDYDFYWDFGDGNTSVEREPTHAYTSPGIYTTYLSLTSPHACFGELVLQTPVEALASPLADFSFTPEVLDMRSPTVAIRDLSAGAVSWSYDFGVSGTSREREPEVSFPGIGDYELVQAVTAANGCVDTARRALTVDPFVSYVLPNAFTPNSDGDNETFRGIGFLDLVTDFRMRIFARWGELIFETGDPDTGWDGTVMRNGEAAQAGVYLYVVDYDTPDGPEQLEGFVTLVR